jgi:two-component system phosphate regulon sensor histidine kinase PhoR
MKRILFRKILLTYIIIASLLLIPLELYLSSTIKDNYILNLKDSLITQARLIADHIPASPTYNLDDFCKRYKEKTGARVTIIDNSGRVIGDSDEPSNSMENHSNRPEVRDAEIADVGSSIRFSKTIQKDLFYLAIAVNEDSDRKFLRLSLPLQQVETAVNKIRLRIIIASLTVPLVVILIGLTQTRRIKKAVQEITDFSKEVAKGNFKKRLFLKEEDELGELSKNIGDMAEEIRKRLRESDEEKMKIETILRHMSDGLILADTKGTILLSNVAIMNLFGIGQTIDGKTVMETLRKAELMELIDAVARGKEHASCEIEVTHPKEHYLMVTATPFFSHNYEKRTSKVVLMFHDITRLKKLEEVRKDFVANVSHEIKTPITAIKGFAETLLDGALYEKENAPKFIETIRNHSERLNSLVDDLLTLSRIELGDIQIEKTNVNLDEAVDAVFYTLKNRADPKGLYLIKKISSDVRYIQADRNRLFQILLNLIDNGIKFTEQGGVTVKAQIIQGDEGRETKDEISSVVLASEVSGCPSSIEISVEDTGIGISKKHLSRLGERFYRVDRARSRELGGTGLGLAIVKHLVKEHGWDMEIESIEGKGTTVSIVCPFG